MTSHRMTIPLALHKLLERLSYGVTNLSPKRLYHLLDGLLALGWSLDGASDSGGGGEPRLELTFDDAYAHLVDILPALMEKYSLKPRLFVPTAWIGRPNTWDYSQRICPTPHMSRGDIRELSRAGAEFGSHGRSHADLTSVSDTDLEIELSVSRRELEDLLGQPVTSISYPFGRVNSRVLAAAESAGYETGYTMQFPRSGDSPLTRGRLPVYSFDTLLTMKLKLSEGPLGRLERAKSAVVSRLSGGTVWLNRLRALPDNRPYAD